MDYNIVKDFKEQLEKNKLNKETIKPYLKALTKLEYAILSLLHDSIRPLSIKQIRNEFIKDAKNVILFTSQTTSEGKPIKEKPKDYLDLDFFEFNFESIKDLEIDIKNTMIEAKNNDFSESFILEKINKILSNKSRIRIPSFGAIQKSMNELINWNIVIKRAIESKKINALYLVNPKIDIILMGLNKIRK